MPLGVLLVGVGYSPCLRLRVYHAPEAARATTAAPAAAKPTMVLADVPESPGEKVVAPPTVLGGQVKTSWMLWAAPKIPDPIAWMSPKAETPLTANSEPCVGIGGAVSQELVEGL